MDEPDLEDWQSGLYEVGDGAAVPKLSAAVVQSWIARTGGVCQGVPKPWYPSSQPVGTAHGSHRR